MKLSKQDADLFFTLMWPLQFFVHQRLHILPNVDTLQAYIACPADLKWQVRQALYEHVDLIDAFIQENPHHFSEEKLALIATWKHYQSGDFYIERLLKTHAIFISAEDKVYAVLALYDSFQDMFHRSQFPVLVKAVLLPFKGKIIYDGLLQGYSIFFGRGISSELKETYMVAKQHGRIIESLPADSPLPQATRRQTPTRDWRPELDELTAQAKKLRAGSDQPPVLGPTFALVKVSVELAQCAVANPNDLATLGKALQKVGRAMGKVETTLDRAERYS
jgi:hypothetical protein